jgi:hypothetical protein
VTVQFKNKRAGDKYFKIELVIFTSQFLQLQQVISYKFDAYVITEIKQIGEPKQVNKNKRLDEGTKL